MFTLELVLFCAPSLPHHITGQSSNSPQRASLML